AALRPCLARPRARHAGADAGLPPHARHRRRLDDAPGFGGRRADARGPSRRALPPGLGRHHRALQHHHPPRWARRRRRAAGGPRARSRPGGRGPARFPHPLKLTLMTYRLPFLALAFCLVFLAACGGDTDSRPAPTAVQEPDEAPATTAPADEPAVDFDGPAFEMTMTPVGNQMLFEQTEFTVQP